MTAPSSIDPAHFLHEQLAQASPDLLRQMLTTFINTLMSAEADAVCGAGYGERSPERTNVRNGYRPREFDTRAGTLEVAIPRLRAGSYFPDWLLERRRRAERALTTVVATCYLLGVSTRRMEKLVESLGISRLSKSQVSEMARELDAQVADFRHRPLDAGPYTFGAADALVLKVREGGRVVNVHALVATGVNADGHREILGLQVTSAEDGAGWLAFFRDLTARGLTGVQLVTADAHRGLVEAVGAALPGASWQRCRTHYAANLMAVTPKASWPWVRALLHSVYDQPDAASVHAQFDRVLDALAVCTLDDGTMATVTASRYNGAGHDVRLEIQGSLASVVVGLDEHAALRSAEPGVGFPVGPPHATFAERFVDAYRQEMQAFLQLVRGERDNPCTPEEAVAASVAADAAQESLTSGEPVRVATVDQTLAAGGVLSTSRAG